MLDIVPYANEPLQEKGTKIGAITEKEGKGVLIAAKRVTVY